MNSAINAETRDEYFGKQDAIEIHAKGQKF
jgi:hypothetical protein